MIGILLLGNGNEPSTFPYGIGGELVISEVLYLFKFRSGEILVEDRFSHRIVMDRVISVLEGILSFFNLKNIKNNSPGIRIFKEKIKCSILEHARRDKFRF